MGIVSSIKIILFGAPTLSQTLTVLHGGGWQFPEGGFCYQHFNEVIESDWLSAEAKDWETIGQLVDSLCSEGQQIAVKYQWQNEDHDVIFNFYSQEVLYIFLDGLSHRLCGRFTDFSWYLARILCPLEKAGYTVLEVICEDDNY